jgi:mannose-6-phosphate isomerase
MKLGTEFIEKPWGRSGVPGAADPDKRIGEIWYNGPPDQPLLLKQIFTSERLSVQVHPNDEQARARGLASGKTECWYILDCDDDAVLGLGFVGGLDKDELRSAALDGSIEQRMHWRPVRAGDFFLVPAGTVHAIGTGIHLIELQQNSDVTYRLYDYGRPRELHVDDAVDVADLGPYPNELAQHVPAIETRLLANNVHFSLLHAAFDPAAGEAFADRQRWVIPLEGRVRGGGDEAGAGDCLLLEAGEVLDCGEARLLIGAPA